MRAPARIGLFALLAAGVGAAGAAVGTGVGPLEGAAGGSHGGHGAGEVEGAPPGLAASADGLTLVPRARTAPRGRNADYAFRIVGADGRTARDFEVEHERRMHMIVVRRDLTGFQHLHPRMGPDGTWRTRLRVADAGAYRVFADFSRGGASHTLGVDLGVSGTLRTAPLPAPARIARTGGYVVESGGGAARAGHEDVVAFRVRRGTRPVADLQPYLGARGHLVALREGDLAYLHVHPLDGATDGGTVRFRVEWPSAGRYRLFLQFRHEGRVRTAAFTVEVAR